MTGASCISFVPARRGAKMLATAVLLTLSAFPFVVFFPQPPAFAPAAAAIVPAFVIPAIVGTAARAGPAAQTAIMRRAVVVAALTLRGIADGLARLGADGF